MTATALALSPTPSLPDAAAFVWDVWTTYLRPEPRLSVDQWAEVKRSLTGRLAAEPGKWRNARTPYLVKLMETLSPDDPAEVVVFQKGSQIGATETGSNWLGFIIDHAPAPTMVVWPTLEIAKRNSLQRLDELIASTPSLRAKVAPSRERDANNTRLLKEFPGGALFVQGANSPASLKSTPAKNLFLDECDEYPPSLGGQGAVIALALRATRTYGRRRKVFLASTPTRAGASIIDVQRRRCEREYRYHVPCPACGVAQELVWEQVRYTAPAGDPRGGDGRLLEVPDVTYACVACTTRIPEAAKTAMLAAGSWVAVRDRGRRSVAFHLSSLYSPLGWFSWGAAAALYEAGRTDADEMRVFMNTVLGLPYVEQHDAPSWELLYARRETYRRGVVPPGVRFLTAGVDVQRDRLEVLLVGWGRERRAWVIDHVVIPGDTATDAPWQDLDRLLATEFPCAWGGTLPIWCAAVDSGDQTSTVYRWSRAHPRPDYGGGEIRVRQVRAVMVIKGREDVMGLRKLYVPKKVSSEEHKRGLKVVSVGTARIKSELYQRLRLPVPATGAADPPGFVHFPELDDTFFRQLTAERIEVHVVRGYPRERWVKDPGARNEALDCFAYANAAAAACGLDRFFDRDWTALERRLNIPVDVPPPAAAVESGGDTPPVPETPGRRAPRRRTSPSPWARW